MTEKAGDRGAPISTSSDFVSIEKISAATYDDVQDYIDTTTGSGTLSGGVITDATGAAINVSAGTGFIKPSSIGVGPTLSFDWAALAGTVIPTDTVRYVGIEYNAGSPQIVVQTTDVWDWRSTFRLGSVVNEADVLHIVNNPQHACELGARVYERFYETFPFQRAGRVGGLILGETGTRRVTLSPGELYDGLNEFVITLKDTTPAGDTFDSYSASGKESSANAQWDNDNYDNAGTLTALGPNKYANLWFYIEADDVLVCVYGTAQYSTLASAENEGPPSTIPARLQVHGVLLGRIIFKKTDATARGIQSAFTEEFTPSVATNHNNLSSLQGGTTNEYYHLTATEHPYISGVNAQSLLTTATPQFAGLTIPGSGNLLSIGTDTESPTPAVTLVSEASGFAAPSNVDSSSAGDKWVFWNKSYYKGAIGFAARTMWFQSTEDGVTDTNRFKFYTGSSGVPVEMLAIGDGAVGFIWNETGIDLDFRVEAVGVPNAFFVQGSDGSVGIGAAPLTNMGAGDLLLEGGSLALKEITTPTADADYGKIYTKNDNKLYFQSGDGTENEIAYVP